MPEQPVPPQDEPKPLSEQLKAIRDEFNELAKRSKDAATRLDRIIWDTEAQERRARLDKTLDEFVPHNYGALKGHDIVFLVNKSKDMGEGFDSPIGAAIDTAFNIWLSASGHDLNVSATLWDKSTKWMKFDSDRMEKARDKTNETAKDLLPAVKEIMIANTPDKAGDRVKHYIIVSDGNVTDNPAHSIQMIETAMQMNPKLTFDFVSFGKGSMDDLAAKIKAPEESRKPGIYTVEKPAELNATIMRVLSGRFAAKENAPQAGTPKADAQKQIQSPSP